MIPGSESCIKSAAWGILYCVILLVAACSDDEPAETADAEPVAKEAPLPVREWYPRQKYSAVQPHISQSQIMQPPAFSTPQPAQQQAWSGGYQVYQAPPVIIVQPQSPWYGTGTAGQPPAQQTATPQQYVNPYSYQVPQRPWGETPQTSRGSQQTYVTPPVGAQQVNPWSGWQAPAGPAYPGWGTPYGGYPGATMPGYVW